MKNIEMLRTLPDKKFSKLFYDSICDYIQDHDYQFCDEREECKGCVETWLEKEAKT